MINSFVKTNTNLTENYKSAWKCVSICYFSGNA